MDGRCFHFRDILMFLLYFHFYYSISFSDSLQYDLPVMYLVNGNENKALRPLPSLPLASVILRPQFIYLYQGIIY